MHPRNTPFPLVGPGTLVLSFCGVMAVEAGLCCISWPTYSVSLAVMGFSRLLEIAVIITVVVLSGKGLSTVGLWKKSIGHGIRRGMIWSAGFGIISAAVGGILFCMGYDPFAFVATPLPTDKIPLLLLFLVGGLFSPIAEEVFFRGVVYGFLRRWGKIVAVTLTTLLFILPHMALSGLAITHFVGGIVFALAYEFERNLLVPIMIHCSGNLSLYMVSFLRG